MRKRTYPRLFHRTLLCCLLIMNPQNCKAFAISNPFHLPKSERPPNTLNKPLEAANVLSEGSHFALRPPAIPPRLNSRAQIETVPRNCNPATIQRCKKRGCDAFEETKKKKRAENKKAARLHSPKVLEKHRYYSITSGC